MKCVRSKQVLRPRTNHRSRSGGMDPWSSRDGHGAALSLSRMQFQLLSVQVKDEREELTLDMWKKCFLQTEEGTANKTNQPLKTYHQQGKTKNTTEISRGMHGITFEVIMTFQQERIRAKKLLAKAATTQIVAWLAKDVEVQQELSLPQRTETIPFVNIECIKKAVKAEQNEDWSTLEADRTYTEWVVNTLEGVCEERCQMTMCGQVPIFCQGQSSPTLKPVLDHVIRLPTMSVSFRLKISSGG